MGTSILSGEGEHTLLLLPLEAKNRSYITWYVWSCRLRAQFGKDITANAVHGPSNRIAADNEIKLIFGEVQFDEEGLTFIMCVCLSGPFNLGLDI